MCIIHQCFQKQARGIRYFFGAGARVLSVRESLVSIDTFFPIARDGMACIPGPFGAGKTVLQNLISRYATVDIVIVTACGERAGEVVETIKEFPETKDPRTGGSLMDRTIIICYTSSMPVAARESSIYTGITLDYYFINTVILSLHYTSQMVFLKNRLRI